MQVERISLADSCTERSARCQTTQRSQAFAALPEQVCTAEEGHEAYADLALQFTDDLRAKGRAVPDPSDEKQSNEWMGFLRKEYDLKVTA